MIRKTSNRTHVGWCGAGYRMAVSLCRRGAVAAAGILIVAAALAGGCTKDLTETPGSDPNITTTKGYATVQLIVPGIASAQTYTAEVADETKIAEGELHAVVYARNEEGNWQFLRVALPQITGTGDIGTDGYRRYNVRIPFQAGDMHKKIRMGLISGITLEDLQTAGGYDAATERWTVLEGATSDDEGNSADNPLAEARDQLTFSTTGKWPVLPTETFKNFPMWGETAEFTMRPEGAVAGVIQLMRAVARVDVGVNFQRTGDGKFPLNEMKAQGLYDGGRGTYFALESVSVYRTSKNGTYGAGKDAIDEESGRVIKPTVATGGVFPDNTDNPLIKYQGEELTSTLPDNHGWEGDVLEAETAARRCLTRQCYLPETGNHGMEFDAAACLVVGGRFGSKNANVTYYRIDFAEVSFDQGGNQLKPTPQKRIDILRNNAYVVNITSVAGPGAPTEDEALHSEDTKLTAEVETWNQNVQVGDIVTDGVYMLRVDKSEQQYYCDGTPETFTVETNYDGELGSGWQLTVEGSEEFKKALRYYDADGNEHAYPSAAWPEKKTGPKGTATLRIGMTELDNNEDGSTATREGKLIFSAGRMKTQVILKQTSRDLLRILFSPEELYFGPQGAPLKGDAKSVQITVTTKKAYKLTLSGSDSKGKAYTYELEPGTGAKNPDDQFQIFFRKSADAKQQYEVLPTNLADGENDRSFSFEVKAELLEAPDVPAATESFNVYQVKEPVTWSVVEEPTKFELREKPWEVIVPYDATQVQPKIETSPGTLVWWFSKGGSTTPDDSWLTNLQSWIGKKIENISANYPDGFRFTMQTNPGLARRSVTLQAESNTPGLMRDEAQLVITQRGAPLTLRPAEQNNEDLIQETQKAENGKKGVYTLDHGTSTDGATYTLDMYSNTDWYWYWNTDNQALHNQNMKYLAQNWMATPGDNVVTTDGPKDGQMEKKWSSVASFTMPSFTVSAPTPVDQPDPTTPPGGQVTVVRELRNSNPQLTEADVADYARELRITRELPAYTHIVQWPFENKDDLPWNLDNMTDADYNAAKFKLLSNATFSLTIDQRGGYDSEYYMAKTVEYSPSNGYEMWERFFKEMPGVMNKADMDPGVPATFYRLTVKWQERDEVTGKNETKSEARIAYTGYHMVKPKVNLPEGAVVISPEEQTLVYDFSNSQFKTRKVRITKTLCYTNYKPVETEHQLWVAPVYLNGEDGQVISSENGEVDDMTVTVTLPQNTIANLLWDINVEFYDEKTGTWAEDTEVSPVIYQDGMGTNGKIAYYDLVHATSDESFGNFKLDGGQPYSWQDQYKLTYVMGNNLDPSDPRTLEQSAVDAALKIGCIDRSAKVEGVAGRNKVYYNFQFLGINGTQSGGVSCPDHAPYVEDNAYHTKRETGFTQENFYNGVTRQNSKWEIDYYCPLCGALHLFPMADAEYRHGIHATSSYCRGVQVSGITLGYPMQKIMAWRSYRMFRQRHPIVDGYVPVARDVSDVKAQ